MKLGQSHYEALFEPLYSYDFTQKMAETYNGFMAENTYREIVEIQEFQCSTIIVLALLCHI